MYGCNARPLEPRVADPPSADRAGQPSRLRQGPAPAQTAKTKRLSEYYDGATQRTARVRRESPNQTALTGSMRRSLPRVRSHGKGEAGGAGSSRVHVSTADTELRSPGSLRESIVVAVRPVGPAHVKILRIAVSCCSALSRLDTARGPRW